VLATAKTFTLDGISARSVRVEADVSGEPSFFSIVGLPDLAVREARERVRAALINCGFAFPTQRITVNLAPANLPKAGPGLDLAIAVALLVASRQLSWEALPRLAITGELALDGSVRSVPGALAMAETARREDMEAIVVPAANGAEAALAEQIDVIPLESLAQLPSLATGEWFPERPEPLPLMLSANGHTPDLADLRGQHRLRQTLEIAAAGGHSMLMIGPPGCGKSLAARRLPSILPPLAYEEALEVARVASACGQMGDTAVRGRPFRAPHHTISASGLIGGGNPPCPGEITLAHRGVVFLDEFCEFGRDTLEALRDPLELGTVSIVRSGSWREFPCRFMLVAAANPCPCGRGDDDVDCTCSPAAVQRYRARLSGAVADRIDVLAMVRQPSAKDIAGAPGECSAEVRQRVALARDRQERRLGKGGCNAEMTPEEIRSCRLSDAAATRLEDFHLRRRLSGRGHDRVLRLAQTIADLRGAKQIDVEMMDQALELRHPEAE
jgi:magnesium chelatase family protein